MMKVALEIDKPDHFITAPDVGTRLDDGLALVRNSRLKARGWLLVSVQGGEVNRSDADTGSLIAERLEEMDCMLVVPPGWSASLDARGFILMSRSGRDGDYPGQNADIITSPSPVRPH